MDIAIIGLPQSGKSTLFRALIGMQSDARSAPHDLPLTGVAKVGDPRLEALAGILKPKRVVPAELTFHDLLPPREGRVRQAIGGQQLNLLQSAHALLLVVRAFHDDAVPHVEGSVDPERDVGAMLGEMALSDLVILERRVGRITDQMKGARAAERDALVKEHALLDRIRSALEQETPIRGQSLGQAETRLLANYQLLTAKPLLIVFNLGEESLPQALSVEREMGRAHARIGVEVAVVSAKLEAELMEMDAGEREEFRQSLGASEVSADRLLSKLLGLTGMVSFFTTASSEVRAWLVPRDTSVPRAAGTIHTDMERGFIRAEVISFGDVVKCGSMAEARRQGLLRLEGKDYLVQDGDVATILFNV